MANKEKSIKIIAIKPGTKHLAVAVLDNEDLVYWINKRIRYSGMSNTQVIKNLEDSLTKLFDFWKPEVIAVEDIFYAPSIKNKLLDIVMKKIKNLGKTRKIKVYFYSPLLVRKFFCKEEKINKMNTAKLLTNLYPWLYEKYQREKKKRWYKIKFGLRIFDAIAVGLFCYYQLKNKKVFIPSSKRSLL
ncbi:MAG: crossover junction endodeoxyribonuclease RuvC [Candidatus Paceibacterota bacterium]|jgi:Holliday junction resolvasome RuvABC endonuclease subunit